jgi:hypothetical protein
MILITALWNRKEDLSKEDPQQFRAFVEKTARWARVFSPNQPVEKNPPLVELPGATAKGYYYSVTDKNPKPREYKFATQGSIPVDELILTFTILTNEADSNMVRNGLHMLGTATQRK